MHKFRPHSTMHNSVATMCHSLRARHYLFRPALNKAHLFPGLSKNGTFRSKDPQRLHGTAAGYWRSDLLVKACSSALSIISRRKVGGRHCAARCSTGGAAAAPPVRENHGDWGPPLVCILSGEEAFEPVRNALLVSKSAYQETCIEFG